MCRQRMGEWIRKYKWEGNAVVQARDEVGGPGWWKWRSRNMDGMERCQQDPSQVLR